MSNLETVQFRFCTVEFDRNEQLVVTRFPDGMSADARPHDTPEYHAHAVEKTGTDDILLYAYQHDCFHVIHGEMHNRPSVVLWALAHGEPTDTAECEAEEIEAQELQRVLQLGRTVDHDAKIREQARRDIVQGMTAELR